MMHKTDVPNSVPGPDDIVRHQFDNGLVALVRENHTSPSVVVTGYLPVGAIDVPAEQAGLAYLTAIALMRGTSRRTFAQIYEELESVGAAASFSSGGHTTGFAAKSLAQDLPLILDVLSDALRSPLFPAQEVERLRGQVLTTLEERANNSSSMASLTFRELAYPDGHPYGYSTRGYPETVQALTREDLVNFYQAGYGVQGMTVCIVGAVHADDALVQIESAFIHPKGETGGNWPERNLLRSPLPAVGRPRGLARGRVDMPDKSQTDVVMGLPGPTRAEPDYLDAALANVILGVFGMMGRLGKHLRDEQGLAYYVYSRLAGGLGPGPWNILAGVDPSNVGRIIKGARDEVRRMRDELVGADELADVKTYVTGSLPLRLETNEGVAGAILNMEQHNLGLDHLARYPALVNEITAERVRAAAQKWFDPDNLAIGIAGPPAGQEG